MVIDKKLSKAAAASSDAADQVRHVDDASTLRALTHPIRLQLIELLKVAGPLTATEAGERIGESPTTCSFHLRQLAKYGFVEEAGGGRGRARPWRMTQTGLRFSTTSDDPDYEVASNALSRMLSERQLERYRTWQETRSAYPVQWRDAADHSEFVFHVTADELRELNDELVALLRSRYRDRMTHPELRPPGSTAVEMLLMSFPTEPPTDPAPANTPTPKETR